MDETININNKNNSRQEYTSYEILSEVLNATSHGIGVILGIIGLYVLIKKASISGSSLKMTAFTIYGTTLIALYLSSTLYHSLSFTKAKRVMRSLDHSSIYAFIAGSYTPYCIITTGGALGWSLFGFIWIFAIIGIVFKSMSVGKRSKLSTLIYVIMGWMVLVIGKSIYTNLGSDGFKLLLYGGIAFTAGAVLYSFKKIKFMHFIWHLFVILGSTLIYFSIMIYV